MHVDLLGWMAAALMVATFACTQATRLRPLAVATNLAFIGYGAAAGLLPVLVLHLVLLPVNLWRWAQAVALSRQEVRRAANCCRHLLCVMVMGALPLVAGCGGGGGSDDAGAPNATTPVTGHPPPAQPAPTIGSAGGTVTSGEGAEVTVPAGALSSEVAVAIQASAASAPAFPAGIEAWGKTFAFTPHGASFARPVTVTVPFDPSRVPAGEPPVLYKADSSGPAAGMWHVVEGAVVVGQAMQATVDAFSHLVVGPPAVELAGLQRRWTFEKMRRGGNSEFVGPRRSGWVEVFDFIKYQGQGLGDIDGNATGGSYRAGAVSPFREAASGASADGTWTHFSQVQTFLKRLPDASLDFTITHAQAGAWDFDPRPPVCPRTGVCNTLHAEVEMEVTGSVVETGKVIFHRKGRFYVHGSRGAWKHGVFSYSEVKLWEEKDFIVETDVGRNGTHDKVNMWLAGEVAEHKIVVPLKEVLVGQRVTLRSALRVMGRDWRQTETRAWASLRDPQNLGGGIAVKHVGLLAVGGPSVDQPAPLPAPAPACAVVDAQAGTLQFETVQMVAEEPSVPAAWVVVTRSGGTKGRVGATVVTRGGTATPGDDYTSIATYVGFADGEGGQRIVALPLRDDTAPEIDETIGLELTDPRGCAALGSPNQATLTILDDDAAVPTPTYRVGGTVSGLAGSGLVLEDLAQRTELAIAGNGAFEFPLPYGAATAYDVAVKLSPTNPAQICTVDRGTGVVAAANVADIAVRCETPPPASGLDTTFGTLGKVAQGLPGGARAIARQSTGHILATNGQTLVRYTPDGRLDPAFNGGLGNVDNLLPLTGAEVFDLAVGADDRIVLAGRALQPNRAPPYYHMAAVRLRADGTRDPGFGTRGDGVVTLLGPGTVAGSAARVLVRPDGRVVLVGHASVDSGPVNSLTNNNVAVAQLGVDGTPDPSFSGDGFAMGDRKPLDFGQAALLLPDGSVVVGGKTTQDNSEPNDSLVLRFGPDGTVLAGWGGVLTLSALADEVVDMALQPDGGVLLLAAARSRNTYMALARIRPDGAPDFAFGQQGSVSIDPGPNDDFPRALALQLDGKVVVAAQVSAAVGSPYFGLLRFAPDGSPDAAFGSGGVLKVPFFGGFDSANDLLVQPDGRVVAAGIARSGLFGDIGMVRLMP
jgi:uncharacterized delta-60 repeat protein